MFLADALGTFFFVTTCVGGLAGLLIAGHWLGLIKLPQKGRW